MEWEASTHPAPTEQEAGRVRLEPNLAVQADEWMAQKMVEAEQHYFAQNEKEYHALIHEFYLSRQQHQEEQHRLNQVLYGPFDRYNPNHQQQQQQPLSAPAPLQRMPLSQYNAAAATNQAPPQPQAMAWQQARPAQLAGSKRHCEPFGDQGAAAKRPVFR